MLFLCVVMNIGMCGCICLCPVVVSCDSPPGTLPLSEQLSDASLLSATAQRLSLFLCCV